MIEDIERRLWALEGHIIELRRLCTQPHERLEALEKRLADVERRQAQAQAQVSFVPMAEYLPRG